MSILAFTIIFLAVCGCYASYAKYHSALHPIFLYNALWLIVTIVLQINTMEWYPLENEVYAVLLVGLISFDFGGLLIGYGTINKSSIYVNTCIEEYEDDEIDYRKVGNRLLMIQLVLTLISIPLFLRGPILCAKLWNVCNEEHYCKQCGSGIYDSGRKNPIFTFRRFSRNANMFLYSGVFMGKGKNKGLEFDS